MSLPQSFSGLSCECTCLSAQPVRERGVVGRARGVGEVGGEVAQRAGGARGVARVPSILFTRVVGQVVEADALAGIGRARRRSRASGPIRRRVAMAP